MTNAEWGYFFFLETGLLLLTEFFVFFSKLFAPEKERGFLFDILRLALFFKSCKFPWSRFTIPSLRNQMNSSGEFWSNCILLFGGKVLDCLENREILCGHRVNISNVATVQVCRILRFFLEFNILTN